MKRVSGGSVLTLPGWGGQAEVTGRGPRWDSRVVHLLFLHLSEIAHETGFEAQALGLPRTEIRGRGGTS